MRITSSTVVKATVEDVWAFLADEGNAPRWDRSVARAERLTPASLSVDSVVRTTAPSGMQQEFRVDEMTAPRVLRFSLQRSRLFRAARLSFSLAPDGEGTRITHDIEIAFHFPWMIVFPLLRLVEKRALGADLDSLRRAIDEGHDLTAS